MRNFDRSSISNTRQWAEGLVKDPDSTDWRVMAATVVRRVPLIIADLEQAESEIAGLDAQIDNLRQGLQDQQAAIDMFDTAIRAVREHLRDLCDESLSPSEMIGEAARRADRHMRQLEIERGNLLDRVTEAGQTIQDLESQILGLRETNQGLNWQIAQKADLAAEVDRLRDQITQQTDRIINLENDLDRAREREQALKTEHMEQLAELRSDLDAQKAALALVDTNGLRERVAVAEEHAHQLEQRLRRLQTSVQASITAD